MTDVEKKKIIGVDIDGVLANYVQGILDFAEIPAVPLCTRYDMVEPGLFESKEDFLSTHEDFVTSGGFRDLPVLDDSAAEALSTLHNAGYEIHIITARQGYNNYPNSKVYDDTVYWLDKNNIPYDVVSLCQDKHEYEHHLDYMIDDSQHNVASFLEKESHKNSNDMETKVFIRSNLYNIGAPELDPYSLHLYSASTMKDFATAVIEDDSGSIPGKSIFQEELDLDVGSEKNYPGVGVF